MEYFQCKLLFWQMISGQGKGNFFLSKGYCHRRYFISHTFWLVTFYNYKVTVNTTSNYFLIAWKFCCKYRSSHFKNLLSHPKLACLEWNSVFKLLSSKLLCLITFLLLLTCACFPYLQYICCCTAPSVLRHSACLSVLSIVTTIITPWRVYVLLSYLADKENYNSWERVNRTWDLNLLSLRSLVRLPQCVHCHSRCWVFTKYRHWFGNILCILFLYYSTTTVHLVSVNL